MINLFYKEYEYKITLGACKYFFEQTGKDLQHSLLLYLEASVTSVGMEPISRLRMFHNLMTFKDASVLFYAVIKQSGASIPLAEIQDAMYRVSWLPTESEDGLCEPWPVVMLELATEANTYFSQIAKKKADI
tara:strand:+ start:529 stop:924 length:396 start_codon:yes stop_codon:yes gene_type:complete